MNYLSIKQITYGKKTLQFNGAKLFNFLGHDFKNGLNYPEFKAKPKTWYGEECLCNNCTYFPLPCEKKLNIVHYRIISHDL